MTQFPFVIPFVRNNQREYEEMELREIPLNEKQTGQKKRILMQNINVKSKKDFRIGKHEKDS